MRALLISFLMLVFITSITSAELLTTANPLGQGTWAFQVAGIQDQNLNNVSEATGTSIGGYIGYGLTDSLDAYIQAGSVSSANLVAPTGLPAPLPSTVDLGVTGTAYGLNLKYTLLNEMQGMPFSVAIGAGYKTISLTIDQSAIEYPPGNIIVPASKTTEDGSQTLVGIGVSKIIVPFIPYIALAYREDTSEGDKASGQYDLTVGSAIAWSRQGAVFVEYTNQAMAPENGNGYTSGQFALGIAYATR